MWFPVDEGQRIMVAWYKDNFALEQIMEKSEYFWKQLAFLLLVVSLLVVVAINHISSHQTVVEMEGVAANVVGQFVEVFFVAMDITDKNDVYFLHLDIQFHH